MKKYNLCELCVSAVAMKSAMDMNPVEILERYYDANSKTFQILVEHGRQVAEKARAAAQKVTALNPDLDFIGAAAVSAIIPISATAFWEETF